MFLPHVTCIAFALSVILFRTNALPSAGQGLEHSKPESLAHVESRSTSTSTYINAAYYPSWEIYDAKPPSSMNLKYLTHVTYAFAGVTKTGSVVHVDETADLTELCDGTKGCLNALRVLKEKQYPHLKLIVSIGGSGGSEPFATVAASSKTRIVFARSVRAFVDKYGYNGVDIDWEYPSTPTQGQQYVALLQALRAYLPAPTYTITTALPTGEWCLQNIPLPSAAKYLDYINLMCYDFAGSWTALSGYQSQLYTPADPYDADATISCASAVSYLTTHGFPSKKIVLGIPAYGRSFLGAKGPGQKYTGTGGVEGVFDYRDLPRPKTVEHVDEKVWEAYCVGGDGGFVSYDNPSTVAVKARYVKWKELAGLFYWTGVGDAAGGRSLVAAGYEGLK